jgi:hypothetical protein
MLQQTQLTARRIVAAVAPAFGVATVERIAINAVMAGCYPEFAGDDRGDCSHRRWISICAGYRRRPTPAQCGHYQRTDAKNSASIAAATVSAPARGPRDAGPRGMRLIQQISAARWRVKWIAQRTASRQHILLRGERRR